ncbi:RNI-like protein [Coniophora puteana RWD-64-598 SS2]|uniref:RNI-like protein n=1 Tax=Coniophora puteana (strain RWD-64-598) TaxID=741705 RepID=A0A5M3MTG7_CONPW|nr:RNI-like protein [Coniophora puteana RWD-64-598 SS2]EIW82337.1 RNI-like protein [Coniophora puteana RWD-64-598 SS2]
MEIIFESPEHRRLVDRLPFTETERRHVRHLVLRTRNSKIRDEQVANEILFCRSLESVVLSGVPDTSDKTVTMLAQSAPKLRGLNLAGCRFVTDISVAELVSRTPPIEWLHLSRVVLNDSTVSAVARTFSRLVELELNDNPLLTAISVRDIWSFSRKLRTLKLARCNMLTDQAFPSPYHEDYKGPRQDDEKPLPHRPSTWLDQMPPLILRYSAIELRVLDISYCSQVTDEAVAGIVFHARLLHTLILAGCSKLTDRAVESICILHTHLVVLDLSHIPNLTDYAITKLVRACTSLQHVDVAFCRYLTDMAVFELAGLERLHRLSVIRVHKITDNAIYFLADHAKSLQRLHISYCDRISLKSLHHLLRGIPCLQHLTTTGVPSTRRRGVSRFSEAPSEELEPDQQAVYRVFTGSNIGALCAFLDKETQRRRESEARNIPFMARSDDDMGLY